MDISEPILTIHLKLFSRLLLLEICGFFFFSLNNRGMFRFFIVLVKGEKEVLGKIWYHILGSGL